MQYRITHHAARQAAVKGFAIDAVIRAAQSPSITYPSGKRHPGQVRHIRDGIVAVVDPVTATVVTVYENVRETALRPDQRDPVALEYGRQWGKRH